MQGKRNQDRTSVIRILLSLLVLVGQAVALPGDLDMNFGPAGGHVMSDLAGTQLNERTVDAALQSDGKIVVLGTQEQLPTVSEHLVARYNANGTLDTSFGGGDGFVAIPDPFSVPRPNGLAIQTDGKIVFGSGAGFSAEVFRLNADGSLDTSFSGDGLQTIASSGEVFATVIDAAGKIVVSTYAPSPGNSTTLVRLNSDGSLDTSFDGDGRRLLSPNLYFPRGLVIQADGGIVVAGKNSTTAANSGEIVLARVLNNGGMDTSFDGDGIVVADLPDARSESRDVAIQADGKIVVAGGITDGLNTFYDPVLMRFNSTGSFDATFDGDGVRPIELSGDTQPYYFVDVTVQPDGKIVAISDQSGGFDFFVRRDLYVARFDVSGALDPEFDNDGKAVSQVCEEGSQLLLQPNGRVVVTGSRDRDRNDGDSIDSFCIQRFNAGGSIDPTFNFEPPDGTATVDLLGINAVTEIPGGRLLIGGWREAAGSGIYEAVLMRLHQNGVLDSSFMDEGEYVPPVPSGDSLFFDIDVLADGGFIASGEGGISGAMLVRFTPDGIPDTSFSFDGAAFATNATRYNAVTVRPDGKIIGCGSMGSGTRGGRLSRFSSTGTHETTVANTFGTAVGSSEVLQCESLIDNRLIVAGYGSDGTENAFIGRLQSTLAADASFGTAGITAASESPSIDEKATGLALQTDGKIIVSTAAIGNDGSRDFAVFRAKPDGMPDIDKASFGESGLVSIGFGSGSDDNANTILVEPGAGIMVAGSSGISPRSFALAKLQSNGSLRLSWGTLGRTLTPFAAANADIRSISLAADRKVLAAGDLTSGQAAIARYENALVPTAAAVRISGQAITASGFGVAGVQISVIDREGNVRSTTTNPFGYFDIEGLIAGQSYVLRAVSKVHSFYDPVRELTPVEDVTDLRFVSVEGDDRSL